MDWQNVTLSELKESMKEVDLKVQLQCPRSIQNHEQYCRAASQFIPSTCAYHPSCMLHLVKVHCMC